MVLLPLSSTSNFYSQFSVANQVQIRKFFNIWLKHSTQSAAECEVVYYLEKFYKIKLDKKKINEVHFILLKIQKEWKKCYYVKERFEKKFCSWLDTPFVVTDKNLNFVSI